MYLKELYYLNQTNCLDTVIAVIALITSFGANSARTCVGGEDKDTDQPNTIISLQLADDSNGNSDDDDESVESFRSDNLNDEKTSNYDISIVDEPSTISDLFKK